MSHQLHVVYSEMIKGVGLHAGGPFLDDELLKVKDLEQRGLIDPLSNLEDAPVFISSGSNDTVVPRKY